MAKNLSQNGNRITVPSVHAAIVSGSLYALGGASETASNGLPGIAGKDGAVNAYVDFIVEGVFECTKIAEAGSALTIGSIVYWRKIGTEAHITGVATAAEGIAGTAWGAAADGATTGLVKLLGQGGKAATP